MTIKTFTSRKPPPPAGTYSVAAQAGVLVFLAGQTPRDTDNVRHGDKPFEFQARMAMDHLEAAARAAGLKNPADAKAFDAIYATYVSDPPPVRTLTQSSFVDFDIEVDAVLAVPLA